jgi:hypothetical protein
MNTSELRENFKIFLEHLIAGTLDKAEWGKYAINHYHDSLVEDVRRETVRIMIKHSPSGKDIPLTPEVKNDLAKQLRRLLEPAT